MTEPKAPGPLAGVRVVERGAGRAAAYAGFLLGGLGADVVKVEPRGKRATAGEHVVNRGKRSADVDAAGWDALVAAADVVVTDESAPAAPPADGLVRCRLTGWDGATDLPPD